MNNFWFSFKKRPSCDDDDHHDQGSNGLACFVENVTSDPPYTHTLTSLFSSSSPGNDDYDDDENINVLCDLDSKSRVGTQQW